MFGFNLLEALRKDYERMRDSWRPATQPLTSARSGWAVRGSNHEPLTPELEECRKAYEIAALACTERQPMPTEGIAPVLIAEACESLGEIYAKDRLWRACADAHRMACWYYRKALAE